MLRSRIAALSLCIGAGSSWAGCLGPMVEDEAGYSRFLLPAGSSVTSAATDPALVRRVDMADGISMGKAPLKTGFAVGMQVSYWELGAGRGSAVPAYQLAHCDAEGKPRADAPLDHPLLIDALPGDADYTQAWAIHYVCVSPAYRGQLVTNMSALSDLYELSLASEPTEPKAFRFHPIVQDGVALDGAAPATRTLYARGLTFSYLDFGRGSELTSSNGKAVTTYYAYELTRPGSTKVERVIFSSAAFSPDGGPSDLYAPIWTIVNVTIAADADINTFMQESDVATANMDRTFTKAGPSIVSVSASQNRATRPIQFVGAP